MMTANVPTTRRKGKLGNFWRFIFRTLPLLLILVSIAQVLILRWVNPLTSSLMMGRQLDAALEKDWNFRISYQWKYTQQLSPHLPIALVAAEDQKFPQHNGFDIQAIKKALAMNKNGGRIKGASTISQQVAKNLFCWSGRSYFRKAVEAWYTLLIELFWPKQRIIEVYANIAEFGDGVYGAEAAARKFFGIAAKYLSPYQCALLAAVLPNPKIYSAKAPSPYIKQRAAWIAQQVRQLGGTGYLTRESQ